MKPVSLLKLITGVGLFVLPRDGAGAVEYYLLTDLGQIATTSAEVRINNNGVVLVHDASNYPALIFDRGQRYDLKELVDLPVLLNGTELFEAFDLNDEGTIVGRAYYSESDEWRAVALLKAGSEAAFGTRLVQLGVLSAGVTPKRARISVNNENVALICCEEAADNRAFTMVLPSGPKNYLPGDFLPERMGPGNDVAGRIRQGPPNDAHYHAAIYGPPVLDLGTVLGVDPSVDSNALAIQKANGATTVVGWSATGTRFGHAFRWTSRDGMVDLDLMPHPEREGSTEARSLNNRGEIVGVIDPLFPHACLFKDGRVVDLNFAFKGDIIIQNAFGWTLQTADSINDFGQIAGWGNKAVNDVRAYVLTPVRPFIDPTEEGVVIRWSAWIENVELESVSELTRLDAWQSTGAAPALEGPWNVVRLNRDEKARFFRLRGP